MQRGRSRTSRIRMPVGFHPGMVVSSAGTSTPAGLASQAGSVLGTASSYDDVQDSRIQKMNKIITKIKPQLKYIMPTAYGTDTSVTIAGPANVLLNPIALGTGNQQRVGAKCRMEYLYMNLQLRDTAGLGSSSTVRVMIVNQKRNDKKTALVVDGSFTENNINDGLFAHGDGATVSYVTSVLQPQGSLKKEFDVIFDKVFLTNVVEGYTRNIRIRKKLGFVTDYSADDDGDGGDIQSNALFMYITSDSSTTNAITATWSHYITYYDA